MYILNRSASSSGNSQDNGSAGTALSQASKSFSEETYLEKKKKKKAESSPSELGICAYVMYIYINGTIFQLKQAK